MANDEWVTGNVTLNIHGKPLNLEMTVPAFPVKPHRMLPVFQQMANSFVDASVSAIESIGEKISCKAGCGACCRQPVPISEIEVYQIAELVESMPEPRRTEIKKRFADGVAHFKKIGWFDSMNKYYRRDEPLESKDLAKEAMRTVLSYFHEGIPCPFLEDESCSIHQNRPVACREYLVTSPAANCAKPTAETVKIIDLLIKPSKPLAKLGSTGRMKDVGLITLIRALELAETYQEDFPEKPGERWMSEFFTELTKKEPTDKKAEPAQIKTANKRAKRRK
ncbi:MAG: YkgJ family cysteine cluster protein [Blastocatellia bacterium]